ncbi:MAG: hypothetical protein OIN66_14345 [Candidatus Methanoperedens sp.]|nr:hypothetical protein [Candidatus Methanoperedens sp.]
MKSKVITITAVLAVLVAMTSVASAANDQMFVYTHGTNNLVTKIPLIPNGPAVPLDVGITFAADRLSPDNGHAFDYTVTVTNDPGGAAATDITLTAVADNDPLTTAPYFPLYWSQDLGAGQTQKIFITVSSTGPVGAIYDIQLQDITTSPNPTIFSFSTQNIDATNIPEFPTIAMPVVGALGILLFFQSRKTKVGK